MNSTRTLVLHETFTQRLFIFDADGTLRRTLVAGQPCPRAPGEWELIPGVVERLRSFDWGNSTVRVGVASNQDQVGYGHLSKAMARALLSEMISAATGYAPPPEAVQLCPHVLEQPCDCRKPEPGMLHRIMDYYEMNPSETLFIGDSHVDREAALRAGVSFAWAHDFFGSSVQ